VDGATGPVDDRAAANDQFVHLFTILACPVRLHSSVRLVGWQFS
jgi:hypothetical protein